MGFVGAGSELCAHWSDMSDRLLIVVAAPVEAEAVLRGLVEGEGADGICFWERIEGGRHDVVVSGVGKANAAGAVVAALDEGRHGAGVVSLGIGGALPGSGLEVGSVVVGAESVFADEGILTVEGFKGVGAMGFGIGMGVSDDRLLGDGVRCDLAVEICGGMAGIDARRGRIATVSTCSGTDGSALEVESRTGALCEAMEGAAVGLAVRRRAKRVGFGEIRVISNRAGERSQQGWDLEGALRELERVASVL